MENQAKCSRIISPKSIKF